MAQMFDTETTAKLASMPWGRGVLHGTMEHGCFGDGSVSHVGTMQGATDALHGNLRSLGSGAFRTAYVDAAGWVYKVAHRGARDNDGQMVEYFDFGMLRVRHFPFVGPCEAWAVEGQIIIAMRHYPHPVLPGTKAYRDFRNMRQHDLLAQYLPEGGWEIADMHDGNVRCTPAGRLRVVDLGGIRW